MKRTVEISTRGTRLSLGDSRLVVCQESGVLARIPIEDIGLVVVDSTSVTISSGVMRAVAAAGGAILACDGKHLPVGLFLPVVGNSLHGERVRQQATAKEPLRKNLWARIVQAKIRNQGALLADRPAVLAMEDMAKQVKSGDKGNREAQAARTYWSKLLEDELPKKHQPFRRKRDGGYPNSLLNYGYAVLRAATARALCGAGLHPGLGIHHHNRFSGFALADDVMEPFRPWVDAVVVGLVRSRCEELDKSTKARILTVLTDTVHMSTGDGPLMGALERSGATLALSFGLASQGTGAVAASQILDLPRWPEGAAAP